ncbi:MAG: hypothetical protein ABSD02_19615 [Steroidobacteraceae bacterium]|jgi:hypothetical protein
MRKTLAAAASAALIILGWADTNVAAAASTTKSVPAENFSCGTAAKTEKTGAPGSSSLGIAFAGNDPTQTFTWGSKFTVKFDAVSKISDVVDWTIADYTGKVHASGSISVVEGTTTASVSCSSTISGYFAVSAKLSKSGVIPAQQGSRPEGYAAFGVLPNVADFVPAFNASLDTRRVGLVGANGVEAGTELQPMNENLGTSWIMTSRSMQLTEPQRAGQYNPATYPIDPSLKEGTLARIVYLNGLPYWASTAPSPSTQGSYPPKSYSYLQSYAALVGEESARIHKEYIPNQHKNYYQASWEPDPGPPDAWKGTDAQFVEFYKSVWEGVHSTDPDAAVIGPATQSLGICASWLERLAPLGFTKYLDAVSCHGYYIIGASSALPPEAGNLPAKVQALRKVMGSVLPAGTKLFVTETGIGYPMGAKYAANYPTSSVLTEHAEAVVRAHLIDLGEGVDTSFVFYSSDFISPVGFGMYFNLNINAYAGGNLQPKPTAMAVAAATRLIDGSRSLGALTNVPSGGYGYSFLLADSSHVMTALWAHNSSFDASESYELQVAAAGTSGETIMFDTMGNPKTVAYSNGLLKVTLSEMPIYVLSDDAAVTKAHSRAPEGYKTSF